MSDSTDPTTLGQRIDAVLEPLYSEAEQHREAKAQAQAQLDAAQQQLDEATNGLAEVESRMTEVVRTLAQQEPVLAAVLGASIPTTTGEPDSSEGAQDASEVHSHSEDEPVGEDEPETVPLDLDPEVDAAMTDEAAALLGADPDAEDAAQGTPPPDITAAAERAAEAAKQLRENAGSSR